MKRIVAILMIGLMLFALCACGNTSDSANGETSENNSESNTVKTKDEMIAEAIELSTEDIVGITKNIAKAQSYKDKIVIISGVVDKIHADYCEIAPWTDDNTVSPDTIILNAYLSIDDLASLKTNKHIAVIGHISDVTEGDKNAIIDYNNEAMQMNISRIIVVMDYCYFNN